MLTLRSGHAPNINKLRRSFHEDRAKPVEMKAGDQDRTGQEGRGEEEREGEERRGGEGRGRRREEREGEKGIYDKHSRCHGNFKDVSAQCCIRRP
eukprot:766581-Hanusia_phi.AAC.1